MDPSLNVTEQIVFKSSIPLCKRDGGSHHPDPGQRHETFRRERLPDAASDHAGDPVNFLIPAVHRASRALDENELLALLDDRGGHDGGHPSCEPDPCWLEHLVCRLLLEK